MGPTLVIELAERPSWTVLDEFHALLRELSTHCEQSRPWLFDVLVPLERLGLATPAAGTAYDGVASFLVHVLGPGLGDVDIFEAEHADDEPEVRALLGFTPTHAVNVSADCNRPVDHMATALLTAAIAEVLGGVAEAELPGTQVAVVSGLPGVRGVVGGDVPTALGSAEFLRAWVVRPGFHLLK
ncbi:DUF6368 family protein [Streptomyces laurentii]|uniref:DUF6368 family protein n=1 Tax=Streptomyces laurentii TaxID=39478 RepID=UPI0036C9CDFD